MVNGFVNKILFFLFISFSIYAQSSNQLNKSNTELAKIQADIKNLQTDLSEMKQDEKESVKMLENINHQSHLLNKVIQKHRREEKALNKKIDALTTEIKKIKSEMDELKGDYARYVKWLYMNTHDSKLSFLISSESFNQAVIRFKYLNYITDKNEERLEVLKTQKIELEEKTEALEIENNKKHKVVIEKRKEQNRLAKRENERKNLITKLKKDQASIANEIDEKRKFEVEIKTRIAKLIEEERQRKIKGHEESIKGESVASTIPQFDYSNFENFTELKGSMSWPVANGKVVREFGENKNQSLKTVTLNYGIDIESNPKENVFAVAQGVVSVIDWIPGFGSIIIITHKGEYRTVYGHIVDILVNEGDIVNAGTQLGYVNESLEGNIVHFEIWNDRNYQNPETWLVKK